MHTPAHAGLRPTIGEPYPAELRVVCVRACPVGVWQGKVNEALKHIDSRLHSLEEEKEELAHAQSLDRKRKVRVANQ